MTLKLSPFNANMETPTDEESPTPGTPTKATGYEAHNPIKGRQVHYTVSPLEKQEEDSQCLA